MSLPAPFARGLLVTTSLAACCLAIPALGQYATTQQYPATQQYQVAQRYTVPPPYSATQPSTATQPYKATQPGMRSAAAQSQAANTTLPIAAYVDGQAATYRARQTSTYGGQQAAPYGGQLTSGYSVAPRYRIAQALADTTPIDVPQGSPSDMPQPPAAAGDSYGTAPTGNGYAGGADCYSNGAVGYMNYSPSCNCLDNGVGTWGLWSNYTSTSPCNGAGCSPGMGLFGRCGCGGAGCNQCGGGGGCAAGCTGGCSTCQPMSSVAPCRVWFGGIYAMFMSRDLENTAWTSYDSSNIANQVLSSRDASTDWQPGNEVSFGSTFLCNCWGWEVGYWALYNQTDEAIQTSATVGAPVRAVMDFSGLDYDDGGGVSGVNSFFDDPGTGGVEAHRVRRHFEVQNIEFNMLYFPLMNSVGPYGVTRAGGGYFAANCGRRFSVTGSAGFRYLRIDDGFQLASSPSDFTFGNAAEDMFYDIEMENHLFGLQVGAAANYQVTQPFSLYAGGKMGIFANYIEHSSQIYGSNGFAVVTGGLPFAGQEFNIQSNKTDLSFLGEIRVGAALAVRPHWRLYGGWRAIGITGYAHPTEQIPQYFPGIPDIVNIDSNGSLIIHGLEAGVELNY